MLDLVLAKDIGGRLHREDPTSDGLSGLILEQGLKIERMFIPRTTNTYTTIPGQ